MNQVRKFKKKLKKLASVITETKRKLIFNYVHPTSSPGFVY